MKAYLIDPEKCSIKEVEYLNPGEIEEIYQFIGATCFDAAYIQDAISPFDAIFVDDNGLLKATDDSPYFVLPGLNPHPLYGKGLVVGCDSAGETIEPRTRLADLRRVIRFGKGVAERFDIDLLRLCYQMASRKLERANATPMQSALELAG